MNLSKKIINLQIDELNLFNEKFKNKLTIKLVIIKYS